MTKKLNNIIFLTEGKELFVRNASPAFLTNSSFCFARKWMWSYFVSNDGVYGVGVHKIKKNEYIHNLKETAKGFFCKNPRIKDICLLYAEQLDVNL